MSSGFVNAKVVPYNGMKETLDITDIYICVYFDGTSNNMYFPQNERDGLDKDDNDNKQIVDDQAERTHRINFVREQGNGNDKYSNVAILYSISQEYVTQSMNDDLTGIATGYSIYIEGAGAKPISGSDLMGAGFGVGATGVVALVSKAIRLIHNFLVSKIDKETRGNVSLHFGIFGFSRGSTCARLLTELIVRGRNGQLLNREYEFGQYLKVNEDLYNNRVCFLNDFDDNKIYVDFLGIYDTVSSIGFLQTENQETSYGLNIFEPIHSTRTAKTISNVAEKGLWNTIKSGVQDVEEEPSLRNFTDNVFVNRLHNQGGKDTWGDAFMNFHRNNVTDYGLYSPQNPKVKSTFHICAMDEFRENFALVNIGKEISNNGVELFIPGCHSDIGGGYMESDVLTNFSLRMTIGNYLTKLYEYQTNQNPLNADLVDVSKKGLIDSGWIKKENLTFREKVSKRFNGRLGHIDEDEIERDAHGNIDERENPSLVEFKRFVKEGYSNISLHAMIKRAMNDNFGLGKKWPKDFQPFTSISIIWLPLRFSIPLSLKDKKGNDILGIIDASETTPLGTRKWIIPEKNIYKTLRSEFLHFTSTDKRYAGIAGNPMKIKERLKASGANLGNPPNWLKVENNNDYFYLLCRLVYNGDDGDDTFNYLYNLA